MHFIAPLAEYEKDKNEKNSKNSRRSQAKAQN